MKVEIWDIEGALKDQKTVLLDSEFEKFLRLNSDFWWEVSVMFKTFKDSAKILSKK
jgi:hypothetical protein